jgi:hypothetical protein
MAAPAPMSNPGSKAPGAGGNGGNQPVINPNASPVPIISGSEPDATPNPNTPAAGTPATILSTGLASAMGVQVGTVVPSGTLVTPAQSAGQKGMTTIATPDGKGGVVIANVAPIASDEGAATSPIANGPQKGPGPAVILSTGLAQLINANSSNGVTVKVGDIVPSGTIIDSSGMHLPGVPTVAPVAAGSQYYEFQGKGGNVTQVSTGQYNSWTPQQQFMFQMSIGAIPLNAVLVVSADGKTWGYTEAATVVTSGGKDTGVLTRYTNPDGSINIQAALAGGVTADYILSHTGASINDIQMARALNAVSNALTSNADGTYNSADINAAVASGKLTQAEVDIVFGIRAVGTSSVSGYPTSYTQDDWDADIASGKIPKGAVFSGYNSKTGVVSYTLTSTGYPSTYTQDQWDADIASGKIPAGSTFTGYNLATGQVSYQLPNVVVPTVPAVPPSQFTHLNALNQKYASALTQFGVDIPPTVSFSQFNAIVRKVPGDVQNQAEKMAGTSVDVKGNQMAALTNDLMNKVGYKQGVTAKTVGTLENVGTAGIATTVANWKGMTAAGKAIGVTSDAVTLVFDGLLLWQVGAGAISLYGSVVNGTVFDTAGNAIGKIATSVNNTTAEMGDYPTSTLTLEERQAAMSAQQVNTGMGVGAEKVSTPIGEFQIDNPQTELPWKNVVTSANGNPYVYSINPEAPAQSVSGGLDDQPTPTQQLLNSNVRTGYATPEAAAAAYAKMAAGAMNFENEPIGPNNELTMSQPEVAPIKTAEQLGNMYGEEAPAARNPSPAQQMEEYNSRLNAAPPMPQINFTALGAVGTNVMIGGQQFQIADNKTLRLVKSPAVTNQGVTVSSSGSSVTAEQSTLIAGVLADAQLESVSPETLQMLSTSQGLQLVTAVGGALDNGTLTAGQAATAIQQATNQWVANAQASTVSIAHTAEQINQGAGVKVEESILPEWLDDTEMSRLRALGLTNTQIRDILKQSGGNKALFYSLIQKAILIREMRIAAVEKQLREMPEPTEKQPSVFPGIVTRSPESEPEYLTNAYPTVRTQVDIADAGIKSPMTPELNELVNVLNNTIASGALLQSQAQVVLQSVANADPQVAVQTAERVRQAAGVRAPSVKELPEWLDDTEFERLVSLGLSADEIYRLLDIAGFDKSLFDNLVSQKLKYLQQRQIDKDIKKILEIGKLDAMYVAPNYQAWERLIGSQRNINVSAEQLGSALQPFEERKDEYLTWIRIDKNPDGSPKITTWVVKMPDLIAGVAKQLQTDEEVENAGEKSNTQTQQQQMVRTLQGNLGNITQLTSIGNALAGTSLSTNQQTQLQQAVQTVLQQQMQTQTQQEQQQSQQMQRQMQQQMQQDQQQKQIQEQQRQQQQQMQQQQIQQQEQQMQQAQQMRQAQQMQQAQQVQTLVQEQTDTSTTTSTSTVPPPTEETVGGIIPPGSSNPLPQATIGKSNGMFTWYQGERRVGNEMRDIWYIIKSPYKSAKDAFVSDYPPKGATVVKGAGAAHLTIKQLTGEAPSEVIMQMGVMDIDVTGKGDKINSIRFIADPDHIYETQFDLKDATYLDSQPKRKYTVSSKQGKNGKKSKSHSKKDSDVGLGMMR